MTDAEFRVCFGINLSKYLKLYGMSVEQLSMFTGISRVTIFRYKAGKRMPTINNVYKISDVFGMSPWSLCDFSDLDISNKYDYGDNLYDEIPNEEEEGFLYGPRTHLFEENNSGNFV